MRNKGIKFLLITNSIILLLGTATNAFSTVSPKSGGVAEPKSHGIVKYAQDGREVLIDSQDIVNLAEAVNTLDGEVTSAKDSLSSLLPKGQSDDLTNIVSLIISGTATSNDVLAGKTFTSSNGIGLTGAIPIKDSISVLSTDINNLYDSTKESLNISIPTGYYENKSVNIDMSSYNSTMFASKMTDIAKVYYKGKRQTVDCGGSSYTSAWSASFQPGSNASSGTSNPMYLSQMPSGDIGILTAVSCTFSQTPHRYIGEGDLNDAFISSGTSARLYTNSGRLLQEQKLDSYSSGTYTFNLAAYDLSDVEYVYLYTYCGANAYTGSGRSVSASVGSAQASYLVLE